MTEQELKIAGAHFRSLCTSKMMYDTLTELDPIYGTIFSKTLASNIVGFARCYNETLDVILTYERNKAADEGGAAAVQLFDSLAEYIRVSAANLPKTKEQQQ